MAVCTGLKPRVVVGVRASRGVALGATQTLMFACNRKRRVPMVGLDEGSHVPAGNRVAGAAVAAVRTVQELPFVLVSVTIQASLMGYGRLEIGIPMALQTGHLVMLSLERELGCGMVEAARVSEALPRLGIVALFTFRGEGAMVRILMATGA